MHFLLGMFMVKVSSESEEDQLTHYQGERLFQVHHQ